MRPASKPRKLRCESRLCRRARLSSGRPILWERSIMQIDVRHVLAFAALALVCACSSKEKQYVRTSNGIVVTLQGNAAKKLRLQVVAPKVIRVTAIPTDDLT